MPAAQNRSISTAAVLVLVATAATAVACDEAGEWARASGIDRAVDFNDIWGASADDVWAVGERAGGPAIWHRDGSGWSAVDPPAVSEGIDAVWGADGQVWIAGHGGVHRRSASGWEGWPEVDAVALWGTGPAEIFAAGSRRVWRFDGASWTEEPDAHELSEFDDLELVGIWGSAADDVWVVGGRVVCECGSTLALYRSSTTWSLVPTHTEMFLKGVWGAGESEVFAVGGAVFTDEGSGIFRYDGESWSRIAQGKSEFLTGIWGSSSADVYAVGMVGEIRHWDGATWQAMSSGTDHNLRDVWGTADGSTVFAVGTGGTILRRDR